MPLDVAGVIREDEPPLFRCPVAAHLSLSFAKTASSALGDDLCFSRQAEPEYARR